MHVIECPLVERPWPESLLRASQDLLNQTLAMIPPELGMLAQMAIQRYPEHGERNHQIALEMGVEEHHLMLGALSYDLVMGFGCSTMAIATSEGPILARNMDWAPEALIARASCVTRLDNGLADGLNAGFVGSVGVVTGLSNRGFAIALNAVSIDSPNPQGYPMLLFLRDVLDTAKDYADAVKLASTTPLASSGLLTLVGTENHERVLIERSPRDFRRVDPDGDRALITTNHTRKFDPTPQSCSRFACATHRAKSLSRLPSNEDLLSILTDPEVEQTITAQHVIARPAQKSLRMWVPGRLMG